MTRYIVQVPVALHGTISRRTWADLPPLEGHAQMSDALYQGYAMTSRWRIVEVQESRRFTVIMDSSEMEIAR